MSKHECRMKLSVESRALSVVNLCCCTWGLAVPSLWREEGGVPGVSEKGFVSSGGAYPHIYDLNLYGAHRGSKCLPYLCT